MLKRERASALEDAHLQSNETTLFNYASLISFRVYTCSIDGKTSSLFRRWGNETGRGPTFIYRRETI